MKIEFDCGSKQKLTLQDRYKIKTKSSTFEDQKKLQEKCVEDANDNNNDGSKTMNTTQKVKEFARDVSVEYASSNRSSCKWCKDMIKKDEIRYE